METATFHPDDDSAAPCESLAVAIVDDEPDSRRLLRAHLDRYRYERTQRGAPIVFDVREFASGDELLNAYHCDCDLILLDVAMSGSDGFETAAAIRNHDVDVSLVFTTNMAQYAIRGYEVNALSYLVKPVSYFAMEREVDRCVARKRQRERSGCLVVANAEGIVRVPSASITYVESRRRRIVIHTIGGQYETGGTLKSFREQLESKGFEMVNSCYLVNLRYVTAVGQTTCLLRNGTRLDVSRRRRRHLIEAISDHLAGVDAAPGAGDGPTHIIRVRQGDMRDADAEREQTVSDDCRRPRRTTTRRHPLRRVPP